MSKQLKIRMIPLGHFIDTLIQIYNSGADFIDLVGDPAEMQDKLGIFVKQEYINNNRTEEETYIFGFEEESPEQKEADIKMLTDDDINQLLNDE